MGSTWFWILGFVLAIPVPAVLSSYASRSSSSSLKQSYKVVCYLGSWSNYRTGDGKFLIEDIDPHLCTHLVYGFAKLGHDNRIAPYDPYLDLKENWGLGAFERFTGLKGKNPKLKALLAIGGWNEGSTKYSRLAKDAPSRRVFVDSCVKMLLKYDFDGLDMDWEYPAARGGAPEDKKTFVTLLKELKDAFRPHGLLLTAAVSAGKDTIDKAYDIPALARYLDLINLMAYDFHGGWEKTTGHNAPLYARPNESEDGKKLNVDYAVQYWLKSGAPANKLILGMPLYGRSFTLLNASHSALEAPVTGKGMAGEFTRERGFVGYHEICRLLGKDKGWRKTLDKHVAAPYIVKGTNWIGYDDVQSIKEKVKYLVKMKLGGAMIWSLETDDFRAKCHGHKYPLLRAINAGLNDPTTPNRPELNFGSGNDILPSSGGTAPPTFTTPSNHRSPHTKATPTFTTPSNHRTPHTKATPTSTTKSNHRSPHTKATPTVHLTQPTKAWWSTRRAELSCSKSGYFRHPEDCKLFYLCQPLRPGSDAGFVTFLFTCGAGTVFSQELRICEYPRNVPGCTDVTN